jgi:GAF domain-containing protein
VTVGPRGYDELLHSITATVLEVFRAAACSLAVLESDEEHLRFRVAVGAGADEIVGLQLPVNRGIAGWAVSSGEAIALEDVQGDARFSRDTAEATGYLPRSIMAAPLEADDRVYGVIEVLDRGVAGVAGVTDGGPGLTALALFAHQAVLALQLEELASSGPVSSAAAESRSGYRSASGASLRDLGAPDGLDPVLAELATMGVEERLAAAALIDAFLAYAGRRRGPAGLV